MGAPTKAAPRRKAKARAHTNGEAANGHAVAPDAISDAAAQIDGTDQSVNQPVKVPEPAVPEHPYGERPVFVFRPQGQDPIVFPRLSAVAVTPKFLWKIYSLNELYQSFEWMNLAGVPRDIQERVMDLPIGQRENLWRGWFRDVTEPMLRAEGSSPPGES